MFIHKRHGWQGRESQVTPESMMVRRRTLMAGAGITALLGASGTARAEPNPKYSAGRPVTPQADATNYNNFYEFGTDKTIARAAQRMPVSPWQVEITGMVDNPRKLDLDDILKQVTLEERIYRHRCVEAWAMTVPWTGFPLSALVKLAQPQSGAQYVTFETLADPKVMPGVRSSYFTWPYVEGVTMQEASNDLAFMVTGMYGNALPKQDGAPLRLVLPWKYGFKSAKSIVKIGFTDKRPDTFWSQIQPEEYGFWANVNPDVPHPRWSQAHERLLGSGEMAPTQIWNGYGEFVAGMYSDKKGQRLFV